MSNENPWLCFVPAGRWQVCGLRAAKAAGLRVIAFDGDPMAEGLAIADIGAAIDIHDHVVLRTALEATGQRPVGVVSIASDAGMRSAAFLSEICGGGGLSLAQAEIMTDKARQRTIWSKMGVPCPRWLTFRSNAEGQAAFDIIGLPAIAKPADSAGSRGVSRIDSIEGAENAISVALANSESSIGLIETFIEGIEFTVESFGVGGDIRVLAVTEKAKVAGTGGTVAQELFTPDDPKLVAMLGETAIRALLALDYRDGPAHTEIIVDHSGAPFLVETAGRGGGFMVFEGLVPMASGYPLVEATVLQAAGLTPPPWPKTPLRSVCLKFIPTQKIGVLRSASGLEEAQRVEGTQAGFLKNVGDLCVGAASDGDRLAYAISTGKNAREARERATRSLASFRFEFDLAPDHVEEGDY